MTIAIPIFLQRIIPRLCTRFALPDATLRIIRQIALKGHGISLIYIVTKQFEKDFSLIYSTISAQAPKLRIRQANIQTTTDKEQSSVFHGKNEKRRAAQFPEPPAFSRFPF